MTTTHQQSEPADVAVHAHGHGHAHEHGLSHSHEQGDEHGHSHAAPQENAGQLGLGAPMLDIGGDIGALVLYTPADLEGQEIEVSLTTDLGHRTHTQIHRRTVNGETFWAGVYAELPEGDYRIWYDAPLGAASFSIVGGAVAEVDWR